MNQRVYSERVGRAVLSLKTRVNMPLDPWGFADQALISAANFSTTVLLARTLQPGSFGAFALLFTLLMLIVTVQGALVTQPHNVLGAALPPADFGRYTTLVAAIQLLFGAAVTVLFLVLALGSFVASWTYAPLVLAFVPLVFAWLCQEFVRRAFYTDNEVTGAVRNDLLCYGLQVMGVLILARTGALTAHTAVAVIAASSFAGFLVGLYQMRRYWTRIGWNELQGAIVEHWRFGRWLLGGTMLSWTAGGWYAVLVIVGVVAAGAWRALITILGPLNILTAGLDSLVPPKAARLYATGDKAALRRFLFQVYAFTAPIVTGYCLIVAIFAERIVDLVFGNQYRQYDWLLPLMVAYTMLAYCQQPVSLTLRAVGKASSIFRAQTAAVIVGPPAGIYVGYQVGIVGAAVGLTIHFVVLNLVLWTTFGRLMVSESGEDSLGNSHGQVRRNPADSQWISRLQRQVASLLVRHGEPG